MKMQAGNEVTTGDNPMRRLVAFGLLGLLAGSHVEAQQQPVAPAVAGELLARARQLLAARRYADAADAFEAHLGSERDTFTIRVAVYCDISNLDGHLNRLGNPPELFLLRRPVGNQSCFGLFWGLFSSRTEADAALAAIPASLRTAGQSSAPVSALLFPGAMAAARPPAPPPQIPRPKPAVAVAAASPEPPAAPLGSNSVKAGGVPLAPAGNGPPRGPVSRIPGELSRAARVPLAEIGLGYSCLWDERMGQIALMGGSSPLPLSRTFRLGWLALGSVNLTSHLGVMAEASGHYLSQNAPGTALTVGVEELGFHAGFRYTHRSDAVATPYAQALFGATRFSIDVLGASEAATHFSIQPGVGVMFRIADQVRIDLGGDYRLVFTERGRLSLVPPQQTTNAFRFHAGVVFGLGER
jgi:hypothetical protein